MVKKEYFNQRMLLNSLTIFIPLTGHIKFVTKFLTRTTRRKRRIPYEV